MMYVLLYLYLSSSVNIGLLSIQNPLERSNLMDSSGFRVTITPTLRPIDAGLMSIGAIFLIIMAWTPYNIYWFIHMIGAVLGIIILLSQILDTYYWYRYCKFMHWLENKLYILTLYSVLCLSSSLIFFIIWMKLE